MKDTTTTKPGNAEPAKTPRVYVASLADYNAGRLLGTWIDAVQDPDVIHEEIRAMLATSPEPIAEDWAIHDHEGFGQWSPREFEGIETVSAVAKLIAEHGEMFASLLNYCGDLNEAMRFIEDGYRGEWTSLQDYVENFLDDVYGAELEKLPNMLRYHIDYEGVTRDFELSGDLFTIEVGGTVHVFEANI
jgi:antirestriction protein